MHRWLGNTLVRLPLKFRVLYRQFLLRVIDLEALSIQADIPRFLGQFAGVLIMFSVLRALGLLIHPEMTLAAFFSTLWRAEQSLISTMMLVTGLVAVISWDNIFPDRRDIMVLSPLPVNPRTILIAKLAASGAVLGLAVLALNCASGLALPLVLGGIPRYVLVFAAYWFTMVAATAFLYGAVLTVQGFTALLLPRRLFLRLSAFLQIAVFALFLGTYFLQPSLDTPAALAAVESQCWLNWSPSFWFFALFNQLCGSLPPAFAWLVHRAWIGLAIVVCGSTASLLLCYLRTMKKIIEEPDLVPGARGWHWTPPFGSTLQTAIVLFSVRSLTRSRQHRLVFSFFLAIVAGIALVLLRSELSGAHPGPPFTDLIMSTFMMMTFAVLGLRSVFSLPITLTANWVLRTTQLCPTENYIAATRRSLLVLAVAPVWIVSALFSLSFRPFDRVAAHLGLLFLLGCILAELCLIGFYKVPFTCSYLPGKSNIQFVFWAFIIVVIPVALAGSEFEGKTLVRPMGFFWLAIALVAVLLGLRALNRHRAKSAVLYFEELPEEPITSLKLILARPSSVGISADPSPFPNGNSREA